MHREDVGTCIAAAEELALAYRMMWYQMFFLAYDAWVPSDR